MIASTKENPAFRPGRLVLHKRYGYRGVVVTADPFCKATDQWYQSNQTQPPRDQPWYHLLVHGSQMTTYTAQTSLEADPVCEPVDHPLLDVFFSGFDGVEHVRNDRPWPDDGTLDD